MKKTNFGPEEEFLNENHHGDGEERGQTRCRQGVVVALLLLVRLHDRTFDEFPACHRTSSRQERIMKNAMSFVWLPPLDNSYLMVSVRKGTVNGALRPS